MCGICFRRFAKAGLKIFRAADIEQIFNKPVMEFIHPHHHDMVKGWLEKMSEENADGTGHTINLVGFDGEELDSKHPVNDVKSNTIQIIKRNNKREDYSPITENIINFDFPIYFCFCFASIESVACGTALRRSFEISFPVSRQIPYVLFSIRTSAACKC